MEELESNRDNEVVYWFDHEEIRARLGKRIDLCFKTGESVSDEINSTIS